MQLLELCCEAEKGLKVFITLIAFPSVDISLMKADKI